MRSFLASFRDLVAWDCCCWAGAVVRGFTSRFSSATSSACNSIRVGGRRNIWKLVPCLFVTLHNSLQGKRKNGLMLAAAAAPSPSKALATSAAEEVAGVTSQASPARVDSVAPDTPSQNRRQKAEEESAQKQLDRIQQQIPANPTTATTNDEDSDRCLICMNGFTKRQPAYKIPCSVQCNDTFVHEKCVYEWKERQAGQGSCPLCRSPLLEMTYVPPDVLRSSTFHLFPVRRDFVTRPIDPQIGMVRMYIKVSKTMLTGAPCKFEVFLQAPSVLKYPLGPLPKLQPQPGDQLLLVARKRFGFLRNRAVIELSLDRLGMDFERESDNFLGHLQCGLSGLDHLGYSADVTKGELCCVQYNQNRIGRGVGPRKMRVCFPKPELDPTVDRDGLDQEEGNEEGDDDSQLVAAATAAASGYLAGHRQVRTPKDSLSMVLRDQEDNATGEVDTSCLIGKNKEPYWLESIMAYSLDFHGRVTLPSNKNFILMIPPGTRPVDAPAIPGDTQDANVCLQFGKVDDTVQDCYTMDVAYPLSVLQASMICLSACDRKLACA
ncbi:hypothetical protein BASA81_001012 [Batrachochytrium salamandrivorans]|nr:hypothetical protein BASA81_001012 [Batrachochytrium salamandrivorans]